MSPVEPVEPVEPVARDVEDAHVTQLRESGLLGLLVFSSLGFLLELLHAFKVDDYLNAHAETRRLLLRLGHAHGTLLSVVLLVLASHLSAFAPTRRRAYATSGLRLAQLVLPLGFLAGGVSASEGDPGALGALIPVGALLFVAALGLLWTSPRRKK